MGAQVALGVSFIPHNFGIRKQTSATALFGYEDCCYVHPAIQRILIRKEGSVSLSFIVSAPKEIEDF